MKAIDFYHAKDEININPPKGIKIADWLSGNHCIRKNINGRKFLIRRHPHAGGLFEISIPFGDMGVAYLYPSYKDDDCLEVLEKAKIKIREYARKLKRKS